MHSASVQEEAKQFTEANESQRTKEPINRFMKLRKEDEKQIDLWFPDAVITVSS